MLKQVLFCLLSLCLVSTPSWAEEEALVIDTRLQDDFVKGFIPGSIFVGIDDNFATWVGTLIADVNQPILIVAPKGKEEEVVTRLSRVGFDNTLGYLKGGFEAWKLASRDYDKVTSISPETFEEAYKEDSTMPIFDVRRASEFNSEHIVDAHNTPLDYLNDHLFEFPKDKTFFLHCAGGYRSMIAASILKSRGIHNLIDVKEGFKKLKEMDFPKTEYVCPTTLL